MLMNHNLVWIKWLKRTRRRTTTREVSFVTQLLKSMNFCRILPRIPTTQIRSFTVIYTQIPVHHRSFWVPNQALRPTTKNVQRLLFGIAVCPCRNCATLLFVMSILYYVFQIELGTSRNFTKKYSRLSKTVSIWIRCGIYLNNMSRPLMF